jgi:hypothetical protein
VRNLDRFFFIELIKVLNTSSKRSVFWLANLKFWTKPVFGDSQTLMVIEKTDQRLDQNFGTSRDLFSNPVLTVSFSSTNR